ncbi:MAG: diguanylate cyclase [Spirochaetales bacterium]|nr:diguanylate cyclase [Spirochaetales bacterium]
MGNKKRLTFGLIIDLLTSWETTPYYQTLILSGVGDFARENDINMICFITGRLESTYEWEKSRNILFNLVTKENIDGLIVVAGAIGLNSRKESVTSLLEKYAGIPIVAINEGTGDIPFVTVDNLSGMKQLTDHLIETHGCRNIAFIKGTENNYEAGVRYQAYLKSLADHDITPREELVTQGDFQFDSGVQAVKMLLDKRKVEFDGLIAANDNMAIGALAELHQRLGTLPENLPVAGFDDAEIGKQYSLTTVHQSFYDQAKIASNLLLKKIKGEKVPQKTEIPTELLIRSTCGCLLPSVTKVKVNEYKFSNNPFTQSFFNNKESILTALSGLNAQLSKQQSKELLLLEERILEALYSEMTTKSKNQFLNAWNRIIFWGIMKEIRLFLLQDILSELRRNILPCIFSQKDLARIEDLFQAARVQIGEAIQRIETSYKIYSFLQAGDLDVFGENLISILDREKQMQLMYEYFPKLGMKHAFIALYEDQKKPLVSSNLIFGYIGNECCDIPKEGLSFPTAKLLPEQIMTQLNRERYSIIVQSLYQGDSNFGFALFDYHDSKIGKPFEIIRYRLSVAFNAALLIEKISNQAQNLEIEVEERTKDLSVINEKLHREIHEKQKVEAQLKNALENLEVYNKKLHNQSLRDELTGLYNRRGFMTLGLQQYDYAVATKKSFMIFFADMDGLKTINDMYGHPEGDVALTKTADLLTRAFRNMDIVARYGGDEFTVLIADADASFINSIRERIDRFFEDYNSRTDKPYVLSISFGITFFDPEHPSSLEDLIIKADQMLYEEKQKKKHLKQNDS